MIAVANAWRAVKSSQKSEGQLSTAFPKPGGPNWEKLLHPVQKRLTTALSNCSG